MSPGSMPSVSTSFMAVSSRSYIVNAPGWLSSQPFIQKRGSSATIFWRACASDSLPRRTYGTFFRSRRGASRRRAPPRLAGLPERGASAGSGEGVASASPAASGEAGASFSPAPVPACVPDGEAGSASAVASPAASTPAPPAAPATSAAPSAASSLTASSGAVASGASSSRTPFAAVSTSGAGASAGASKTSATSAAPSAHAPAASSASATVAGTCTSYAPSSSAQGTNTPARIIFFRAFALTLYLPRMRSTSSAVARPSGSRTRALAIPGA